MVKTPRFEGVGTLKAPYAGILVELLYYIELLENSSYLYLLFVLVLSLYTFGIKYAKIESSISSLRSFVCLVFTSCLL